MKYIVSLNTLSDKFQIKSVSSFKIFFFYIFFAAEYEAGIHLFTARQDF